MGPCFWPSLGEGKRRSCRPGCLPPESCVSSGGELFTVTLGAGPGMKPQMNSSCSGRSWLKQTAPSTGRALLRGPELLEPGLEQEGCGASLGSCHAQGTTCHKGPSMGTVAEAPSQGLGHSCHPGVLQASLCSHNPCFPISSSLSPI